MNYLHKDLHLSEGEVVEVVLDHPANVQLLDAPNFEQYKQGKPFRYFGGYSKESPVRLTAPSAGQWHIVIDLGGGAGSVRATLRTLSGVTTS
ncbi:DUF1883 domain-containing protein [Fimbriiglobus ruber]|uniref:DUF1883 domain-containing protein n=1 Tax=Fimbriiglobus ruber TaxID=1908690 RepID=A0A225DFA3_9BACT|nr:DUF1883 domain-containing protein [Fimbriiglobus ruber]OWK40241.1 hypothetical protein FRUB_05160 [Fimbriiglobus ruber]